MVEIVPAIMPTSVSELEARLEEVKGLAPIIQLDVMDGLFVPAKDWPYVPGGMEELEAFAKEERGFPYWEEVDIEVDLMIRNPETVVEQWVRAGARRIVIHLESTENLGGLLSDLEAKFGADTVGMSDIGLAINTTTPIAKLAPHVEKIDFVQCMGIERIGRQGEPFDERVLAQLSSLRAQYPSLILSVDGGVNFETAPLLIEAGAQRLVSGSTIFGSGDIEEAINNLRALGS